MALLYQAFRILCLIFISLLLYALHLAVVKPLLDRLRYRKYKNVYLESNYVPFLGTFWTYYKNMKANKAFYTDLIKNASEYEEYDFRLSLEGIRSHLVVTSNQALKEVIRMIPSKIDKIEKKCGLHKIALGSFLAEDTTKRTIARRRAATKILGFNSASRHIPIFLEQVKEALGRMEKNKPLDFLDEMNRLTFKIFATTLFGEDVKSFSEGTYQYENPDGKIEEIPLYAVFLRDCREFTFEYLNPLTSLFPIISKKNLMGQYKRNFKNHQIFQEALKTMISKSKDQNSCWAKMSQLKEFTDDEIFFDLIILLAGGAETSSHLLTSFFYYLAKNPDVKTKLLKELEENGLSEDSNEEITMEKVEQLNYLQMVVKEALRMDPPITLSNLYGTKENVKVCGVPIPKDTILKIEYLSSSYFDKNWLEPTKFKPERFDPSSEFYQKSVDQGKVQEVYSRRPFSHGPRNCPGQTFALLEVKTVIAYLLPRMNYSFDKESMENPDIGFAAGSHFKPKVTLH